MNFNDKEIYQALGFNITENPYSFFLEISSIDICSYIKGFRLFIDFLQIFINTSSLFQKKKKRQQRYQVRSLCLLLSYNLLRKYLLAQKPHQDCQRKILDIQANRHAYGFASCTILQALPRSPKNHTIFPRDDQLFLSKARCSSTF